MAVNLSAISQFTTTATALANVILVTPQKNAGIQAQAQVFSDGTIGPQDPSFLFNYEGEETFLLESDITDHFVEDNTAIQDQIALKPEMVTTHGFIGELNDIAPALLAPLKTIADKLLVVGAFTPQLTTTALIAYNQATQAYSVARLIAAAAVSAWNTIGRGETQNEQQKAFNQFYGYWQKRTLFTIQTPWNIMKDMAIKNLRAVQDADTRVITEFEITFKKMKFAQAISSDRFALGQGRWNNQSASLIDKGISTTTPGPTLGAQTALNFPGAF